MFPGSISPDSEYSTCFSSIHLVYSKMSISYIFFCPYSEKVIVKETGPLRSCDRWLPSVYVKPHRAISVAICTCYYAAFLLITDWSDKNSFCGIRFLVVTPPPPILYLQVFYVGSSPEIFSPNKRMDCVTEKQSSLLAVGPPTLSRSLMTTLNIQIYSNIGRICFNL